MTTPTPPAATDGPPRELQVDPDRVIAGLRQQLASLGATLGRELGQAYARQAEQDAIITQLVVDQHAPAAPGGEAGGSATQSVN